MTEGHEGELLALFSSIESPIQTEHPTLFYPQVLEKAIQQMASTRPPENGPLSSEQCEKFGQSIANWPAFPDSAAALQYLQKHYKLVILSNVDRSSFALSEAKLGVKFDLIITAQDSGAYKPAHNHFTKGLELLEQNWGIKKEQVLHTFQSLYHDAVPANELAISTAHINRAPLAATGGATPIVSIPPHLDYQFKTLQEMADQHQRESK